jgi:glutamate N-acetyltransferase / amino-acid N-acetyltransferase
MLLQRVAMKALPVSPFAPASFPQLPAVAGVMAAIGRLGLYKHVRDDLLVMTFAKGTVVAGALTRSSTRSDDVDRCRAGLNSGMGAGMLVVNAGNSNAFTGDAGLAKNAATIAAASQLAGCDAGEVYVSATGVIGQPVVPDLVASALPEVFSRLAKPDWPALAATIATTDTFPKGSGATLDFGNGQIVNLAGIAKGSGMVAPDMATMLVYIVTDAPVERALLQAMVSAHVDTTFNAITVDSDTSTSDTLLVFATGAAGGAVIAGHDDPRAQSFSKALHDLMADLALQVVRDGEGATKQITITVSGATSDTSARTIAMAIANSPLVKTAIAGEDANWGRVVMAVGKSREPIDLSRLAVRFGNVWTARDGGAIAYDEAAVDAQVRGQEIEIGVDVGIGTGVATVWTCDLTHGYITINGDYRT